MSNVKLLGGTLLRSTAVAAAVACACSLNSAPSYADVFYYDNNGTTGGFGNAGNTWGSSSVISSDSTGVAAPANTATTTADTLNLGTDTLGLGGGTITVAAGGRSIGSLVRGSAGASIMTLQGGTITFAAAGFITNNNADTLQFTNAIAGGGTSMTFTNATLLGANTYAGATIINSLLRINSIANGGAASSTLGTSSSAASNLVFNDGAILRYDGTTGTQSTDRNFRIDGTTAQLYVRGNGNLTWNGTASFGTLNQAATLSLNTSNAVTGDGLFAGVLADNGSGQLSLRKIGTSQATESAWTLSNANTFTGSTTIAGGVLRLTNVNALQNSYIDTTNSTTGTTTAGLFNNGASALNIGGLSGNKDLLDIFQTGVTNYAAITDITLNVAAANNLDYSGGIGGARSLTKSGAGTQTLSGTHGYTGATTITAGTLIVNGSLAAASSVAVTGGTLGGTGTIGGNVTVGSASIAPGTSPGTLVIDGDLGLASGSVLAFDLNAGDQTIGSDINDLIDGVNALTLDGTLNVTSGALSAGTWRLINYSGLLTDNELSIGSINLAANHVAAINTAVNGQVDLVVTLIPEPASLALAGLGLLLMVPRRRR